MIKINIKGQNIIDELLITGHANYDDSGKDIVCASVSSILITTVNAIIRIDNNSIDYKEDDGVCVTILKHTKTIDILLDNLVALLQELKKQYPKYIEIRRC